MHTFTRLTDAYSQTGLYNPGYLENKHRIIHHKHPQYNDTPPLVIRPIAAAHVAVFAIQGYFTQNVYNIVTSIILLRL